MNIVPRHGSIQHKLAFAGMVEETVTAFKSIAVDWRIILQSNKISTPFMVCSVIYTSLRRV